MNLKASGPARSRTALANRPGINGRDRVAVGKTASACRTDHRVLQVTTDVIITDHLVGIFVIFQRPHLDSSVDETQVVHASNRVCPAA